MNAVTMFPLSDPEAAAACADALAAGESIVIPTDTVYGIAADATNPAAVDRLQALKGRDAATPPPLLIADAEVLPRIVETIPSGAAAVAEALWPGALTLIVDAQAGSPYYVGFGVATVAVRVPDHPQVRALLRRLGVLAVSSANRHGEPPATTVDEAIAAFGDEVAVYLDGGPTPGAVPSTVVDFSQGTSGRVLRAGAIDPGLIERIVEGAQHA
ncbi:MAG: threonylcarbamoyl-AMP synthase [Propionibacteriaceae bacterium]|jgi:tRNA threonylcarbamoyl adenosine modification protein (Sua5/YciO/YrdC/YwlC family)|nr:threonylcarbamoyl-AMP synthase [Propionibacteriaceae bacterium]